MYPCPLSPVPCSLSPVPLSWQGPTPDEGKAYRFWTSYGTDRTWTTLTRWRNPVRVFFLSSSQIWASSVTLAEAPIPVGVIPSPIGLAQPSMPNMDAGNLGKSKACF